MSSLRGEQALKAGVSFEFAWAARHLIEVMEERADAIMLGGLPGEKGVDFRLYFKDREEHHQVKRSFGTSGNWTLAALDSDSVGVLPDFRQRLVDPKVHCYMVSGIPATQLGYLAERARKSSDFASYETHYLDGEYGGWFADIVKRWGLSHEESWNRLQRIHTYPFDENYVEKECLTLLRAMVVDHPEHAWDKLRIFCFSHLNVRVTSSMLWKWLREKKIQRQIVNNDTRVITRIEAQTQRYVEGVRQKLINPPLQRGLSTSVIQTLAESPNGEDIVILGSPGGGKSAVMLQIAEGCLEKGWPVLAFRLDELRSDLSAKGLQDALDLPDSPAACMARASAGNPAIVIIDQLDAVSEYSGRTGQLFNRVSEFIQELRAHRLRNPIHLVIACREVDWQYDARLRPLHRSDAQNKEKGIHKVENLTDEEIKTILQSVGLDLHMFSVRQRGELLCRPQYLALLIETSPDAKAVQGIVTPKLLFDAYWDKKERALSLAFPSEGGNPWFDILKHITDKLADTALALTPTCASADDGDAPLAVTRSSLGKFSRLVIDWMISNGVLSEGNRRVRFGHESFFDYCFARMFEEREQSLLDYLLTSDQTLIQRGQLRQVLAYQRDEDLATYLASIRDILFSDHVRPHLKNLLATVICEVSNPKDAEWHFIHPIITKAITDFEAGITTSISCQVFYSFCNSLPLFKLAYTHGHLAEWLKTSRGLALERLFWAIGKHQPQAQQEVWVMIAPLINQECYHAQFIGLSYHCHVSQSRETFDWLLNVRRNLNHADQQSSRRTTRFYGLVSDLAKNKPEWLPEWLAAVVIAEGAREVEYRFEILNGGDIDINKIKPAADFAPREFLVHLLPALTEVLKNGGAQMLSPWRNYDLQMNEGFPHFISADEMLFESLFSSLLILLDIDRGFAIQLLDQLRNSEIEIMRRLHVAVLCSADEKCLQLAADYLIRDKNAFSTTYRGKMAACHLLEKYGPNLNSHDLAVIESAILECWPKNQNTMSYDKSKPNSLCFGNYRGLNQMKLLRSFPSKRLSLRGIKRLREWERKFPSTQQLYGLSPKTTPANQNVLARWSPGRFLKAVVSYQNRSGKYSPWKNRNNGNISAALTEAVKKNPAEFIHFLGECDALTPVPFIEDIDNGLMNIELDSELALEAAKNFHRLDSNASMRAISYLKKAKKENCLREAMELALHYFQHGEGVTKYGSSEQGKKGEKLSGLALNSVRGRAIGLLCQILWTDPDFANDLKPILPEMMRDRCPAIRTELASLCYALAFKQENRPLATELFLILTTNQLPDEHILASYWPFEFMLTGLIEDWSHFKPILNQMMLSSSSEVRCASARLIVIGVVSGIEDALEAAKICVKSDDPNVRAVCAEVISHNTDVDHGQPWINETLLTLADDPETDVCRAAGAGFKSSRSIDFGSLSNMLARYVKTRAFVRGSSGLIHSFTSSRSLLPTTIFDIVEALISRLDEPVEEDADKLIWHINEVTPVLTRLYHENRDGVLRKRALNLIDKLCVRGHLGHDTLDQ